MEAWKRARDKGWVVSYPTICRTRGRGDDRVQQVSEQLRAGVPPDQLRAELTISAGKKSARLLVAEAEAVLAREEAPGPARTIAEARLQRDREEQADRRHRLNVGLLNRRAATAQAQDDLFLDALTERLRTIPWHRFKTPAAPPKRKEPPGRVLNLLLSDLHFQSLLDPREVPVQYGPHEEARRLAAVVVKAADFKRQYRGDTELRVHLAGDIVQNHLHDARDAAPMAQQHAAALVLLKQAVCYLASQFSKVKVSCTPGNHGRYTHRHVGRAVHQKWDSHETAIYYGLKVAVEHIPNITIEISRQPFYTFDCLGERGFVTHGDTVFSPGVPQRQINTARLAEEAQRQNAAEAAAKRRPFGLFVTGHVHFYSVSEIPGTDSFLITNAALVPPDPYAVSLGVRYGRCGQALWESVPGRILGDARLLDVGESEDRDASLERVIRPFTEF